MFHYGIAILGISEMQWKRSRHLSNKEFMVYHSGNTKNQKNGIGFIIGNRMTNIVIGFNQLKIRMASILIQTKPLNLIITQVYTSTAESRD